VNSAIDRFTQLSLSDDFIDLLIITYYLQTVYVLFGIINFFLCFSKKPFMQPRLNLFDEKYSKVEKYYNLK